MDLMCKLLEDRGIRTQAWLLQAQDVGPEPLKWTLLEGSLPHWPAVGPPAD